MGENGWAFYDEPGVIPDNGKRRRVSAGGLREGRPGLHGARYHARAVGQRDRRRSSTTSRARSCACSTRSSKSLPPRTHEFYPEDLRDEIDETIDAIYEPINNGVYRSGFATRQEAYEEAVTERLRCAGLLGGCSLLRGATCAATVMTEADWCLFPTLVRFDSVYHGHFKCNLRRIVDYPNLWGYLRGPLSADLVWRRR